VHIQSRRNEPRRVRKTKQARKLLDLLSQPRANYNQSSWNGNYSRMFLFSNLSVNTDTNIHVFSRTTQLWQQRNKWLYSSNEKFQHIPCSRPVF